ncbi:MAG: radical SAM family heme chaperone HemW [Atopobiaceae bacterium]
MRDQGVSWEERTSSGAASAIYVHIPFCARKCAYCDFASWATRAEDPLMDAYAKAVLEELARYEEAGLADGAETAYIGGGTPSYLGKRLVPIVQKLSSLGVSELTSEANPDSVTERLLFALKDAGLTRISLGVQSTDDHELALLGRIHTADEALAALGCAASSGLAVSADLMCALPDETDEIFAKSVRDVLVQGVCHVSVYPLMIEEGTAFGKRFGTDDVPSWNDPDIQAARMKIAERILCSQGFRRYEVASYAKPGRQCRHNKAYWSGKSYLGIGTGASGMLSRAAYERARTCLPQLPELPRDAYRIRLRNTSTRRAYAEGELAGLHFSLELLDRRQALAEDLMLAVRMSEPMDQDLVSAAREEIGDGFLSAIGKGQDEGLLGEDLAVTERGWLLGNELFELFWDLAGDAPTRTLAV